MDQTVFRMAPKTYIHVLDATTNITRVEVGPRTFVRQENEQVVLGPESMITVPSRHYVIIENPVIRDAEGQLVYEGDGAHKQVKLKHAEQEIRLACDPFPLWPGEVLRQSVTPLTIVKADTALKLRAVLDFEDQAAGVSRVAGDEWLFRGPGTYTPRVEVQVDLVLQATIILPNQSLRVRARKEMKDHMGVDRVTGEEWLVSQVGAYLPGVFEEVIRTVDAIVLTDKVALHVRALKTFSDVFGKERRTGEEWLITTEDTDTYIPGIYEDVVAEVEITVLTNRQYAVVLNPCGENGRPDLGAKKQVVGPAQFFLKPGEELQDGAVQEIHVLSEDSGLVLKAIEAFTDDFPAKGAVKRNPGDRWMVRGPTEFVPPVHVEVVAHRRAIPLDDSEGIYVRDTQTGAVRAVIGETYMLNENEELWDKTLPPQVEELLSDSRDPMMDRTSDAHAMAKAKGKGKGRREKSRVVSFRVPHNAACQLYDFKQKKARVVFGPEMVMLQPDEQFTQLSLSGGKPKRPNEIQSLCLLLGPDFCTDIIVIETADHARLQVQLSYNWHFDVDQNDPEAAAALFSVPDFVGDLCKAVASRVRGAVAGVQFDDFHKNSAKIIRSSVFGLTNEGKVKDMFQFSANKLCITSIDIQSAEPVDQRTRDALQKSVQLAIEITTNSQEAAARHEAQRLEQEARGRLERQKIQDEAEAESSRMKLLELQASSAAVESSGQAKAEAQSRAEAARIEGEAAVKQAELKASAQKIEAEAELERLQAARKAELDYIQKQDELELAKAAKLAEMERVKFESMVAAIGSDTLLAMAQAGPEMQVKLLQGLGIQSTLITDGKSPINLFQTANGLIGGAAPAASGTTTEQ